ncbi:MAG: hypothetical protein AAF481_13610 [Acidobacteriota bacterium]
MPPARRTRSRSAPPDVAPGVRLFLERYGRLLLVVLSLTVVWVAWALWTARYRSLLVGYDKAYEPAFAEREFPALEPAEVLRLGSAHSLDLRPASSYTHFPPEKPVGTIRIGVFGGSFVAGAETPPGGDFPSHLEERLAESSAMPVEVLNFGVGGFGIHQAVLMWRTLGQRYGIDIAVFDVFDFHQRRDQGFVHQGYGPVHSRFILGDDGEPRRIDPAGRDRLDAIERYFAFLPRWRYLRYDVRGPAALRAFLPAGREIARSPFYYWDGSLEEESTRLATALLASVAEETAAPIVICNDEWSCGLRQDLEGAGVYVMESRATELSWKQPSFYRAPRGHLSSLGNRVVAEELWTVLMGRRQVAAPVLGWKRFPPPQDRSPASQPRAHRPNLQGADRIAVLADRAHLGEFVVGPSRKRAVRRPNFGATASLLDLSTSREIRLLPLSHPLPRRSPANLHFVCTGEEVTARLGFVDAPTALLGRFVPARGRHRKVVVDHLSARFLLPCDDPQEVRVSVAGRRVLRGEGVYAPSSEVPQRFRLVPIERQSLVLRSHRRQILDPGDLPERGILRLTARREGRVSLFAPLARWSVEAYPLVYPEAYPRALAERPPAEEGKTPP